MSTKMLKISVLGVLVIVGLGGGFVASILTSDSEQGSSDQTVAGGLDSPSQTETSSAQENIVQVPPGASELFAVEPKHSPLNELVRELRYKIEECKKRQAELEKRENRIAMIEAAIKDQTKELENRRIKLVMPLTQLKEAMAEWERTRIRISIQEKAEIQKTAAIYEKMDSVNSSQILVEMCSNNENDVVKILYYMSERSAAKCLAQISNSSKPLAAKLSQRIKVINQED